MNQDKDLSNESTDTIGKSETKDVFPSDTAPTREMPGPATANTVTSGEEGTTGQVFTEVERERTDVPKKRGLGYRLLHSKDSTKLIGALAFCTLFATCTLLVATGFHAPMHLDGRGSGIRMEQPADSHNGDAYGMGPNGRFDVNGHINERGNGPDGGAVAPNGKRPDIEVTPNDDSTSGDKGGSDDSSASNNDGKPDMEHHDDPSDTRNAPDGSSKSGSSDSSKTAYIA